MEAAHDYTEPVAALLTYGACDNHRRGKSWPDYPALGLSREDVPELIRMATDPRLNGADGESLEVWAPLHAWRALGQLKATEAAEALVKLFDDYPNDDWLPTELGRVFALMGPNVIPVLEAFLANDAVPAQNRLPVTESLREVADAHPEQRERCVDILARQLEKHPTNDRELNAFLVMAMGDLHALDRIDLIREAFEADNVDINIVGDLEDVEISMGLRKSRSTPRPRYNIFGAGETMDRMRVMMGIEDAGERGATIRREKVGRNEPCPCGSGKKYKKCCLQ